jgi:hypothetical protein
MAAAQMEALEKDYEGQDAEIGMMINIVQVIRPNGQIDNRVQHNAQAPFLALGLMRVSEEVLLQGGRQN